MGKLVKNKKATKFTLIGMGAAAILLAVGLVLMPVVHNSEAAATKGTDEAASMAVEAYVVDSSQDNANQLFDCKIEDINDTAAVARLFEAMKLESVTGEYEVTISAEDGIQMLSLSVAEPVQEADKAIFDANLQKCAEQMLALIPSIGKVQWNYSVVSTDAKEESISVSLDEAGANKELDKDVRSYGKSANKLQKLLAKQAED